MENSDPIENKVPASPDGSQGDPIANLTDDVPATPVPADHSKKPSTKQSAHLIEATSHLPDVLFSVERVDLRLAHLALSAVVHADWVQARLERDRLILVGSTNKARCEAAVPLHEHASLLAEDHLDLRFSADLFVDLLCNRNRWLGDRMDRSGDADTLIRFRLPQTAKGAANSEGQVNCKIKTGPFTARWPVEFIPLELSADPLPQGSGLDNGAFREALQAIAEFADRSSQSPFATLSLNATSGIAGSPVHGRIRITEGFLVSNPLTLARSSARNLIDLLALIDRATARWGVVDNTLHVYDARIRSAFKLEVQGPKLTPPSERDSLDHGLAPVAELRSAVAKIVSQIEPTESPVRMRIFGGEAGTLELAVPVNGGLATVTCPIQRSADAEVSDNLPTHEAWLGSDGLQKIFGLQVATTVSVTTLKGAIEFGQSSDGKTTKTQLARLKAPKV
ncbi:MAG TPA: hypothetical protein VGU45_16840 [Microvirga sp.]|nr:hypothetical protein [Microvirga sp.]